MLEDCTLKELRELQGMVCSYQKLVPWWEKVMESICFHYSTFRIFFFKLAILVLVKMGSWGTHRPDLSRNQELDTETTKPLRRLRKFLLIPIMLVFIHSLNGYYILSHNILHQLK